jgi:hypothetical protein
MLGLSYLVSEDKLLTASPSAIAQCLPLLAELASGKYALGVGKNDKFNSEEMMVTLKVLLKRVKGFNPIMEKETRGVVEQIIDMPIEAFKELDEKEKK